MEVRKLYWMQMVRHVITIFETSESKYAAGRSGQTERSLTAGYCHEILLYLMRAWNLRWSDQGEGGYPVTHHNRFRYAILTRDVTTENREGMDTDNFDFGGGDAEFTRLRYALEALVLSDWIDSDRLYLSVESAIIGTGNA